MTQGWLQLINAPVGEIHRLARDLSLAKDISYYARVLSAYLQGDSVALEALRQGFAVELADCDESVTASLKTIVDLRVMIRRRVVRKEDLQAIMGVLDISLNGNSFSGETLFCLGMAWEIASDDLKAKSCFAQAAVAYRAHGCLRKALRAWYNSVAADSRLNPEKNFVGDYQAIIAASRASGDREFEGMALAMLSREYQVVGLHVRALRMINKSLMALQSERGCLHYYHSVLHKAHVLIDLERYDEVGDLLRESEMAPFPAITAARKLLTANLDGGALWDPRWERDLLPSWRNRVPQLTARGRLRIGPGDKSQTLTALEEKLVKLAYNGPIEKWDLIGRLYPEGAQLSLHLENRFKNLVARVRRKCPGLVTCQEGRYSVAKLPGGL